MPQAEDTASPAPSDLSDNPSCLAPFATPCATVSDALYGTPAVLRGAAGPGGGVGSSRGLYRLTVAVESRWDDRAVPGRGAESCENPTPDSKLCIKIVVASTVVAVGLTIAAAGFAGRYVLQAMKHMEPQVKQVFQSLPKSAFSGGYYRGGFEPKMTKREAALILGVRIPPLSEFQMEELKVRCKTGDPYSIFGKLVQALLEL
ncbi:hypothetical protein STEG23_003473 [Scotinomys teguina]